MDAFRGYDGGLPWSPEEIQAMLTIWADSTIQKELEACVRNEKVFLRISSDLAAMGFLRSAKQCREKVKKLKQEYRKHKDPNSPGGLDRKGGKWFHILDSVLGSTRPTSTAGASVLPSSAVAILEAMSSPSQTSEDSALMADEPIVEVQVPGDEPQTINQAVPEETVSSDTPEVSGTKQDLAVKRKRPLCSSDEWKKMLVQSDERYLCVLHRMLESEGHLRREELRMRREEMELKKAEAQLMKDEASSSSAVQGQLVSVLGQIAELFRARQSAPQGRATLGRQARFSARSLAARRAGRLRREICVPAQSDGQAGAAPPQAAATMATAGSSEENQPRPTPNIIKTEVEEPVSVEQTTDADPINVETAGVRYEENQAHSTTQEASTITVQEELLAAQQEQCQLMAEHNSIQRTLVRAVSRSNRCMSELAKSVRAQTAAVTGIQERIVQLLERQEWTNQLLTMKVMGVSSAESQNPQEGRAGFSGPAAGPSAAYQDLFPGQEAAELSLNSPAADH